MQKRSVQLAMEASADICCLILNHYNWQGIPTQNRWAAAAELLTLAMLLKATIATALLQGADAAITF